MRLLSRDFVRLRDKRNHYISTIIVSMATIVDRMVDYLDWFLPEKSHESLIKRFCEIMLQARTITYALS